MKYTIDWLEAKFIQSLNKSTYDAVLTDENGVKTEGVTIWPEFPGFSELKPGSEVNGDIVVKQNGKYTSKSLYASKPAGNNLTRVGGTNPFKRESPIARAQEVKREDIKVAQQNKNDAITLSASFRDATLVLVNLYPEIAQPFTSKEDVIKEKWNYWQKWFLDRAAEEQNNPGF